MGETVEAQYNAVEDGQQLMEATEVTLQDNGKSSPFCAQTLHSGQLISQKLEVDACCVFRPTVIMYLILYS